MFIIATHIKGGYSIFSLDQWLSFKYMAKQDIQPDWEQVGIYNTINELIYQLKEILEVYK